MTSNNTIRRGDVEEREQVEFRSLLEKLLKDPSNKRCADCGTAAPRWASSKIGVFLCIKCSGIHRAMGTHISFIRSVSLDKWKPEEIAFIQSMGNANAALIWEAKLPAEYRRPSHNDSISLEKFIRDKYEYKRYFKPPAVDKGATTNIKPEPPSPSPQPGVLQPPQRSINNNPRPNTQLPPQPRIPNPSPPVPLVDPFLTGGVSPAQTVTSNHTLFTPSDFPGPQQQQINNTPIKLEPQTNNVQAAVDINLLKKSNIMSMFDVQTEQQKLQQQQQQQQQQALLQQQMYFTSPQLYYSTSGGLIPVMYTPQTYGPPTVVYPQHF